MSSLIKRFVLKHAFQNVSEMSEDGELYSEEEEHFNVPWRVFIARKDGHLSIFLNCWKPLDGPKWSIQTNFELKLAAGGSVSSCVGHNFGNADGNIKYSSKGSPKFIEWEEMKEKHLSGDKLAVEAHVTIVNMTGFYTRYSMVFDDQNMKNLSDVLLIVSDKSFFISKQLLASQSSYFEEVFNVSHKNKDALKFTRLDVEDFQKYLEIIYGQSGVIDDANVEGILLIAKRLSTPSVIGKCEEFLMENSKKSLEKKMQMANRYGSDKLKSHCHTLKQVQPSPSTPLLSTSSAVSPQIVVANSICKATSNNIEIINEVVEYRSPMASVDTASDVLNVSHQSGLKCTWSGNLLHEKGPIDFTWKFEWDELKQKGIDGFTGQIVGKLTNSEESFEVDVDLIKPTQIVESVISNDRDEVYATFEYFLIPIYNNQVVEKTQEDVTVVDEADIATEEDHKSDAFVIHNVESKSEEEEEVKSESITSVEVLTEVITSEDMFLPSKKNDTILVVEAKLLYVNNAYLSYHSDYFEHLFAGNEKEQFEIEDVTYEDFSLLMRAIYPESVFPSEASFLKLAELADRFQMPTVTRQIENLILKRSQLEHPVLMGMADKYGMTRLLEKSIHMMDSARKAKKLIKSPEFADLSLETKARILERVADVI